MNERVFRLAAKLAPVLLATAGLMACGKSEQPDPSGDVDPMVQRALNDPIMVDSDLVSQSFANSALAFEIGQPMPSIDSSPAAINAAREAAIALIGGSSGIAALPQARGGAGLTPAEALNAIGRTARLTPPEECVSEARFSAVWAARLPQSLAIYPRGNTTEALGADTPACRLRTVIYLTPVPASDVLAFHHTNLDKQGLRPELAQGEGWQTLSGTNAQSRYEIALRELPSGLTEVGIVSLELR